MTNNKVLACAVSAAMLLGSPAFANKTQITSLEKRIADLENKLNRNSAIKNNSNSARNIYGNKFNPSIGIILNGQYSNFSKADSEIAGFAVGEEGERGKERFSIGESELNFSSNIDDKFFGSMTAAIVNEEGSDKIELEEAFIKTKPGFGLPTGLEIKAGRAFWNIGYLNEHHAHTDDFADRPLPYRAFLNKSFNDDGVQVSYVLPTDFYAEIGGGSFRGDDFPFGEGDGTGSYSAYATIGGDIGDNQSWKLGVSALSGEAKNGRVTNEEEIDGGITFTGESDLYIADLRYTFAPTGNAKNQELTLQGEYFHREESGSYRIGDESQPENALDQDTSGWYLQTVYKFKPQWRVGLRYSKLNSDNVTAALAGSELDAQNHNPQSYSAMIDWTNSEFSRVRLQYNHEELANNNHDNHVILQYVMSFGAHSAHKY
jgi:hypothetical protein